MYKNTNLLPQKGQLPSGLAAYHERKRQEKLEAVDDDIVERTIKSNAKVNTQKAVRKNNTGFKADQVEKLIYEYELELFKINERSKDLKRIINKLKKEL